MPINVNFYDEVVYITSPTDTVTIQELLDAFRAAEDTPEGIAFGGPVATLTDAFCDAEGSIDVGGGYLNPITMTLDANWYIEFWSGVALGTVAGGNVTGGKDDRPVRAEVASADTVLQLGAERGIQTSGALSSADIADITNSVWADPDPVFMLKVIRNKKTLTKVGSIWSLHIFDDDNITPILSKELKDKDGNNISDLAAGTLATELLSSV